MYLARLSLICLIAFVFMVGCGLIGNKAEMTEEAAVTADMKTDGDMVAAAVEEVTLNVTGMTWGACTSAVQGALSKVTGVSEVVSVSTDSNSAVVKVEKGKVTTDALIKAVESDPRFKAKVAN